MKQHDIPLNIIVTPDKTLRCPDVFPRPKGIYWNLLSDEMIESIPLLKKMQRRKGET